jgi:hypothetical protein
LKKSQMNTDTGRMDLSVYFTRLLKLLLVPFPGRRS